MKTVFVGVETPYKITTSRIPSLSHYSRTTGYRLHP